MHFAISHSYSFTQTSILTSSNCNAELLLIKPSKGNHISNLNRDYLVYICVGTLHPCIDRVYLFCRLLPVRCCSSLIASHAQTACAHTPNAISIISSLHTSFLHARHLEISQSAYPPFKTSQISSADLWGANEQDVSSLLISCLSTVLHSSLLVQLLSYSN